MRGLLRVLRAKGDWASTSTSPVGKLVLTLNRGLAVDVVSAPARSAGTGRARTGGTASARPSSSGRRRFRPHEEEHLSVLETPTPSIRQNPDK